MIVYIYYDIFIISIAIFIYLLTIFITWSHVHVYNACQITNWIFKRWQGL